MQVANALNNVIRILFNPKVESFKLFDILLVKSEENRYLAQIIEIYDDKFDASQNVAKLKLYYKINEKNQVIPYDNFTPNKECEISKIDKKDVESFINDSKETFPFGVSVTTDEVFNVQKELFSNNPIILADKADCANEISVAISKKLADKKVLIVDFTGVINYNNAGKIKAVKDFRLPLNYFTLDFVFDKFLSDASLEFQAVGNEILKALKKFASASEDGFIPFNVFTKVIKEQYKATPHSELKLFLARLERCQLDNIFAKNKSDCKCLSKALNKNQVTIVDLSNLNGYFQKLYFEFLLDDIKDDIYLLTRINDENCDVDLINKIYNKKQNIDFIPNVSFSYKKLPSILQYCKNYIMFPSLHQRIDFVDINSSLANIISGGCLLFGENTNNFMYFVKDFSLTQEETVETYKTISLSSLQDKFQSEQEEIKQIKQDNALKRARENYNPTPDSQKLMKELSIPEKEITIETDEIEDIQQAFAEKTDDFNEQITVEHNAAKKEIEQIEIPSDEPELQIEETIEESTVDETEEIQVEQEDIEENSLQEEEISIEQDEQVIEETVEVQQETPVEENEDIKEDTIQDENKVDLQELTSDEKETFDGTFSKELKEIANKDFAGENIQEPVTEEQQQMDKAIEEIQIEQRIPHEVQREVETIHFSDEELDFYSDSKETSSELPSETEIKTNENEITEEIIDENIEEIPQTDTVETVMVDDIEYKTQNDVQDNKKKDEYENLSVEQVNTDEELDLSEVANNSIDASFEQIINEKAKDSKPTIEIDSDVKINEEPQVDSSEEGTLPIFKEPAPKEEKGEEEYTTGDVIVHKKYGKGKIIKTIKYEHRQLLQIEFEGSGKKLLDPAVADIKLEQ